MNWDKVKTDSPLAFKACIYGAMPPKLQENYDALIVTKQGPQWLIGSAVLKLFFPLPYHRSLYDFFDQNSIFINPTYFDANIIWVEDNKIKKELITDKSPNRREAEYVAFEEAFKWLNEKLLTKVETDLTTGK